MFRSEYYIMKTKEKEERRQKKAEKTGKKGDKEVEEGEGDDDAEDGDKEKEEKGGLPKGSVIHLAGLSEETTREDIKERLGALEGRVAFVDFKKGDVEGWARLQGDDAAAPVFEKMENGKVGSQSAHF